MTDDRERHARFLCRMWDDQDWIALSPRGQWFYMLLTSQASLNRAGVTALTSKRWKRLASGPAVEQQIALAMKELEDEKFIVVDSDTEELLVRSYMRNDGIVKQPNVLKAACRQAREILSPKLRAALLAELRRLDPPTNESAAKALAATIEALAKGSANPSPDPSRNGSGRDSSATTHLPAETSTSEPLTEPFREPFVEPRGVGEGETYVGRSSSVGGSVCALELANEDQQPIPPSAAASVAEPVDAKKAANKAAQELTRAYTDLVPLSNFPAVMAIVKKARAAGRYEDPQIRAALERLGGDGRSVTTDSLRYELEGFPTARASPNSTDANIAAFMRTGMPALRALPGGAS
jgi:hypothetical protein